MTKPDIALASAARETKPLNKLAQIAVRQLNDSFAAQLSVILEAAAPIDGISAEDGWGYDPSQGVWSRQK